MTRVTVNSGICGHTTTIQVEKIEKHVVRISLDSECERVAALAPELAELNWRHGVFCKMVDSKIYQAASQHLRHTACPIPSAILKAIEVEVGIALPKDVIIHFEKQAESEEK